jgi:hypothetical protein
MPYLGGSFCSALSGTVHRIGGVLSNSKYPAICIPLEFTKVSSNRALTLLMN